MRKLLMISAIAIATVGCMDCGCDHRIYYLTEVTESQEEVAVEAETLDVVEMAIYLDED